MIPFHKKKLTPPKHNWRIQRMNFSSAKWHKPYQQAVWNYFKLGCIVKNSYKTLYIKQDGVITKSIEQSKYEDFAKDRWQLDIGKVSEWMHCTNKSMNPGNQICTERMIFFLLQLHNLGRSASSCHGKVFIGT